MHKRIIALCLALCLIFAAVPAHAGAATTQTVSANQVSVNAGNSVTLTVTAENFVDVASLDLFIYYDAAALTVTGTYNGYMLSGTQADVNTATPGEVKLSAISLDGINGSGTLLQIYFQTNADYVGTYPIKVAVGDAYDTSLEATQILATDGSVTVKASQQQETFLVYTNTDRWSLQQEDVLTVRMTNGYSYQAFVSADFTVTYDPEIFALESAELDTALLTEGAIYSVNSSILGQVRISYASTEPVSTSNLLTVKLRVIADRDGTTTVTCQASNVYREDLTAYGPHSRSSTLTLNKLPEVIDYPDAFLETEKMFAGSQSTSVFILEAGTGIAAADFTVTYDPAVLRCVAVTKADASHGGMVIINDNFSEGKIRFSYVNTNTYAEQTPLVQITWEPLQSPDAHYEATLSGVGVVDAQQNPITLEYVTQTGCIHECVVTPPTCIADGYTTYTCHGCGDSYTVDPVPMLGHDIQTFEAKAPTCTEGGWSDGEGCIRCDYRLQGEVYPALGHDLVDHEAKEPTCTEIGWHAYQTCSRGDYSSYEALPALGHRVILEDIALVDPLTVDNSGETAFVVTDGTYYSNNHTSSSSSEFTVTALYDCTLNLIYGVSSEARYDKLFILLNGTQQDVISGEVSDKTLTLSLVAGDVVTVRYAKDGSVDRNEDRGWASLVYDHVLASAFVDAPAEDQEATCTDAIVCAYCQEMIKEALPHTWNEDGTTPKSCTTCGQTECDILGHSYATEGTAATCTEPGQLSHTCTVCGHAYTEEVAPLGHDLVDHDEKEPTCTEIGWDAYQTCSRCDYSSYAEIAPLGHRVIQETEVLVDPLTIENTGENAFVLEGGTYYSNNYMDGSSSSFSVIADYDCTLTLTYGVSSETYYDKFRIDLNGGVMDEISGEVSGSSMTLALAAGDIVTFSYTKDVSASNGEDRGWVALEYAYVSDYDAWDTPAEDQEPDCVNGVICAYCQTVVKEALGHSYETVVTDPTCTEGGYTTYTCTVCGESHIADEVEPLGHSWSAWEVTVPATCTEPGEEFCSCICGLTQTRQIPAGHSYENGKCTACGEFENEEAALRWAMDLSGDGEVTAFDSQILAEALAGIRTLTEERWTALGDLTPEDILDYVLGRYELPAN